MIGWVGNGDAGPERGRSRGKSGGRWLDDWLAGLIAHENVSEQVVVVAVERFKSRDGEGWGGSVWTREIREIREFYELLRLATIFFLAAQCCGYKRSCALREPRMPRAWPCCVGKGGGGRQKCSLSLQLTPAYSVLNLYPDHSPLRNKQLLNDPLN